MRTVGDWEFVKIRLSSAGPIEMVLSRHTFRPKLRNDAEMNFVDGTHPVVYSAINSHAHYVVPETTTYQHVVGCIPLKDEPRQGGLFLDSWNHLPLVHVQGTIKSYTLRVPEPLADVTATVPTATQESGTDADTMRNVGSVATCLDSDECERDSILSTVQDWTWLRFRGQWGDRADGCLRLQRVDAPQGPLQKAHVFEIHDSDDL